MNWKEEMKKARSQEYEIVNKFMQYMYNISAIDGVSMLFEQPYHEMEDHRKQYVQKFIDNWNDVARIWGMLDDEKRQQLMDAMKAKYG
jgi:division protein CdvB (Snf7/Vps24/ESCRT-III family)